MEQLVQTSRPVIKLKEAILWRTTARHGHSGGTWLLNESSIVLLDCDRDRAKSYRVRYPVEMVQKFTSRLIDYIKEIRCDENDFYALVGRCIPLFRENNAARAADTYGFLIIAKLNGRQFEPKIFSIIALEKNALKPLQGEPEVSGRSQQTTNAYIEQPGRNKVMYISFRNSDRLFAMRTNDIQAKLSEAERYHSEHQDNLFDKYGFNSNLNSMSIGLNLQGKDRLYMSFDDKSISYVELTEDGSITDFIILRNFSITQIKKLSFHQTINLDFQAINILFSNRNPWLFISRNPGFSLIDASLIHSPQKLPEYENMRIRSWTMLEEKIVAIDTNKEIVIFGVFPRFSNEASDFSFPQTIVTLDAQETAAQSIASDSMAANDTMGLSTVASSQTRNQSSNPLDRRCLVGMSNSVFSGFS